MTDKSAQVLKSIQSFLKMYSEETCELIKINYWNSLENTITKSGLGASEINSLIFNEIFKKNFALINDKNLTFLIFNFCFSKSTAEKNMDNADNFFCFIYQFLDLVLQNYDSIFGYVKEYVLEYSVNLLSETSSDCFDFAENRSSAKSIAKYFSDFLEIDFAFFSSFMISISNQISALLKNVVFKCVFKKFLKMLLISSSFSSLIYIQSCIVKSAEYALQEKIELLSFFIELSISVGNFGQGGENTLISDDLGKIFYFELLKNSVHYAIENGSGMSLGEDGVANCDEFYALYESYLLFIVDNSKVFAALILENYKIFSLFFTDAAGKNKDKRDFAVAKFKKVFPISLLNLVSSVNSFSSLDKLANLANAIKQGSAGAQGAIKSQIAIKMLQKIFTLNGKLKNFANANSLQTETLRFYPLRGENTSKIHSAISLRNFEITYKNNVSNLYNISNLNLLGYIIENSLVECDNKFYFDDNLFYDFIEVIFSLNFEAFDSETQSELIKNILLFMFVVYENLDNGLDFFHQTTQKIFAFFFHILKANLKLEYSVNEIYPILISFFQTVFFPKISKICAEALETSESNYAILHNFFDFLISFGRVDSMANLTSKFLITILNAKGNNLRIKAFALEKFVSLAIYSNCAKFYLVFFNHVCDSLKKLASPAPADPSAISTNSTASDALQGATNVYLYSLWDLAARYQGSLPFEILTYFTNKFEECLNKLPEEPIKFEHLVAIEAVNFIILKDQNESLFEKMLENVLNMKFMKIFDKLFQKAKNLEVPFAQLIEVFLVDDNKLHNYDLSLFVLFHKNFKRENLEKLSNQDFNYLLLIVFLSRLFSGFLSNLILHNKDKFNIKTFSDKSNNAINSIIKTFDYISASLIFLSDDQKTFSHLLFLNEIFSNAENLNFFYNTHSYLTAIENIDKNNLDYSMLNETNIKIISEKNKNLFYYSKYNEKGIFFFKKTVLNLLMLEINSLSILENKSNLNPSLNNGFNCNILNSVYLDSIKAYVSSNHSGNKNITAFYLKFFLDAMFNIAEINTSFNKNLYYFCLSEKVFEILFKNIVDLVNVDYINVCVYGILHYNVKECQTKLASGQNAEKDLAKLSLIQNCFLDYLIKFTKISKSALQFAIRILGNYTTFSNLLIANKENNNNGKCEISDKLFSLIDSVITTILYYNSYNIESYDNIVNILNNVQKAVNFESAFMSNLNTLGKLISNLFISLTIKKKLEGVQSEINKKLKDQLAQAILSDFLYFYLEKFLDTGNPQYMDLVKNDFEKFFENILVFKNFKKVKMIKEINNEICIRKFEELEIFKIIFLITDLTIPTYLHNTVINLFSFYRKQNHDMKFIIENFLNYNFAVINKKSAVDFMKNIILGPNEEKTDNALNSNFTWDDKFKIINFVMFDYLLDENILKFLKRKEILEPRKIDIVKNVFGLIHFNAFLRSDLKSTIFERFNEELINKLDDDRKEYLNNLYIN